MKFILDTYALIEISTGNKKYEKYLESDVVTLKDNLAEMFYFLLRKYDEKTAMYFFDKFCRIAIELPLEIVPKSMLFRHTHKDIRFSYIDCLGYICALESKRFFLTGDRAFKDMKNIEIVR